MKCTIKSKRTVLGVVMSMVAIIGFIMIVLAIAEKGPFSKQSDSSLTSKGGNSGTPLPLGTPKPPAPVGWHINAGFALLRRGLPSELGSLILENVNEWKDLRFAFKRTRKTEDLFDLIERYDNARSAAKGGNDARWIRRFKNNSPIVKIEIKERDAWDRIQVERIGAVEIHNDGRIVMLEILGLTDDDIRDLSFLPKRLKRLCFTKGSLTHITLSELPRGLEHADFSDNQISGIVIESVPPLLETLTLWNNPMEQGITFKAPFPISNNLNVFIPRALNVPLDLNGGIKGDWNAVTWQCGSRIFLWFC